jgi:gamma-glutamylputrescine oxidase
MSFLSVDQDLARDSYYAATAQRDARFAPLDGSSDCDVAVVGGGLAGLTAALDLARMGHQVTLLEAKQVGWGASGRNGGQAIHGLACDQSVIEDQLGLDDARRVWSMSLEALELLQARLQEHRIDAEWRQGYIGVATNARKGAELMQWADRMAQVYQADFTRIPAADMSRWVASPRYHSGLYDPQSGHLHPLKYALGIARAAAAAGVRIHEETPVTALETGPVITLRTARARCAPRRCCWPAMSTCRAWPSPWSAASCRWGPTSSAPRPWTRPWPTA